MMSIIAAIFFYNTKVNVITFQKYRYIITTPYSLFLVEISRYLNSKFYIVRMQSTIIR